MSAFDDGLLGKITDDFFRFKAHDVIYDLVDMLRFSFGPFDLPMGIFKLVSS